MPAEINNGYEEAVLICDICGSEDCIAFVQYGSYVLKCAKCKANLIATSFIAVIDQLSGAYFEAIEIDDQIHEIRTIATGKLSEIKGLISTEAGKGKLIWLKPTS